LCHLALLYQVALEISGCPSIVITLPSCFVDHHHLFMLLLKSSLVWTKTMLKNVKDIIRTEDGHIKEAEIRKTNVEALVINEKIRKKLGL
jgi:hypothetical protein